MQSKPQTDHKIELNSAEVANLWTSYMSNTGAICLFENFLSTVEDREIRSILELAMLLSKEQVPKLTSFFKEEKLPVPDGFSVEKDVNKETPRLFTDDFYIFFIQNFCEQKMDAYSYALSTSARFDMSEYFTECLHEISTLYNKTSTVLLSKGIFIRSPYIPAPKKVEYVEKQNYLAGWFGHRRPINVIEITGIYYNMIRNQLGRTLCMGYSQVAKSKKVRDYFIRGRDIADKHVEEFASVLSSEFLPSASTWDTLPTSSTEATFSDKIMMYNITILNGIGVGNYGRNLGTSPRRDLGLLYTKLMSEIALFAEDGANIMIDNAWLEQPPQTPDRDQLAHE
ncbi:hypothetical protein CR203_22250 [Salipaludibacillus neizhouensis]|uniref:DUF3231 domain-containing protein n=1 Tax=Salipaludibacillus neizhouensis TaxID=885475 RepID=A0A3A9JW97_9BACI|nr:DUF3231 family protein [Salipaludibacillus neizhouensis]RKL65184.1 hypothetical protein CR203_22250 [Salipaludibacillus neizhouensis]